MRNRDATKVWHNPEILSASRDRAPETATRESSPRVVPSPAPSKSGRIVTTPSADPDPRAAERQKLLGNLLRAAGRPAVSKAADAFSSAGFTLPDEQDVHLQLLEHVDEEQVRSAIDKLASLLAEDPPQRRAVLESRLRRIEQFAEEPSTRVAAERLRRQVSGHRESSPQ